MSVGIAATSRTQVKREHRAVLPLRACRRVDSRYLQRLATSWPERQAAIRASAKVRRSRYDTKRGTCRGFHREEAIQCVNFGGHRKRATVSNI